MRAAPAPFVVLALAATLAATLTATTAGCDAASAERGLSALLRVEGAQWTPGATPEAAVGPPVLSLRNPRSTVWPGQVAKSISGTLAPSASAVSFMLEGDRGHWIVPAGAPDAVAPAELTFAAHLAFAAALPLGQHWLLVRAVDPRGHFGPTRREPLLAQEMPPIAGELVFSLAWDTNADLDLHVVDPQGIEVWARNINSYQAPPPGQPEDPEVWRRGGILDHDSNAGCLIDGRRRENVVWAGPAPAGTYLVRVDAASLCGQPAARWTVQVIRAGVVAARAAGTLVESSTRGKHAQGSGLFVLMFSHP